MLINEKVLLLDDESRKRKIMYTRCPKKRYKKLNVNISEMVRAFEKILKIEFSMP